MDIAPNATRRDLRRVIERQRAEIASLRKQAEIAQEVGVVERIFDPEEAVLPWQDFDSTVARLEGLL